MPVDLKANPKLNRHDFQPDAPGSDNLRCFKCGMTDARYYESSWGCLADPPVPVGTWNPGGWQHTVREPLDPRYP